MLADADEQINSDGQFSRERQRRASHLCLAAAYRD
jgi:hypothetical protein